MERIEKNYSLPPVVMVGYDRHAVLRKSLNNLSQCYGVENRDIYLFLDAPYKSEDNDSTRRMYEVACEIRDEKLPRMRVVKRVRNYGVPGNLIDAVTSIINDYGRIVFFEDDVLVSRTFLEYIDEGLELYKDNKKIWAINGFGRNFFRVPRGYKYDVYLSKRYSPWGWGSWADRWNAVDFELRDFKQQISDVSVVKKVDDCGMDLMRMLKRVDAGALKTWDVQCGFHIAKEGLYCVEPRLSLTKNIGWGKIGLHCLYHPYLAKRRYYNFRPKYPEHLIPDECILQRLKYLYWVPKFSVKRIVRYANKLLWYLIPDEERALDLK